MEYTKQELLEAVNALIDADDAKELFEAFTLVAAIGNRAPVLLAGHPAVLNPLLHLKLTDALAFDRVFALVEAKRADRGRTALVPPKDTSYDKTTYMRHFMDAKREREKRAAEIENLCRPEKDRLRGGARLEFMRNMSVKWRDMRDRMLEVAAARHGGPLPAAASKDLIAKFWSEVDADLERKLADAKRMQVSGKRGTAHDDMSELMAALKLPGR